MSDAPAPRPLYLEADGPPAFAIFHASAEGRREAAVLLCPPFGWEDMCSYRSRRDWAERLAAAGHPALRLDLPGSGDSAGGPRDQDQLETWTRALSGAAQWLAQTSGAARITAIGIGLGGMLACRAALGGAPIAELVLWHVPARGRALVRELRAFSGLEVAYTDDSGQPGPGPEPLEEGALVANGYLLSAETVAALERLDLAETANAVHTQRRVLLLGRDGLKADERLRRALELTGAVVTIADGPGYAAMMAEPQDARPPTAVFELVDAWLMQAQAGTPDADAGTPLEAAATPGASKSGSLAHDDLSLVCSGVEIRETPICIDGSGRPLLGILAEPLGENRGLCAVLMNAGPQRRTGPNRMWVEIARRWAARGVPTLRFDLAGMGDSDGDAAALAQVGSFYTAEYLDQTRATLNTLAARGLPERFVVVGLCAGAYWSTHSALGDERIASLIMLNPRSLVWDEWVYGVQRTRELRERLLLASTWRKVLHGEITLARHTETARALASRLTGAPRRLRKRLDGARREGLDRGQVLAQIFDSLRDREQRVLLLFTGAEPLHAELARRGLFDRPERWPNLELRIIGTSTNTHTLTPIWLQREVHELLDRVLDQELADTPSASAI